MASIQFTADTAQVNDLAARAAALMNQTDWITARAMTEAAKMAKVAIERDIFPLIQGGPNRWTRRGLLATYAHPTRLASAVGFNYGGGALDDFNARPPATGTPSGRYMEINARGGKRQQKSYEKRFGRSFLIPNQNLAEIDQHGNLPGPLWTQAMSRIGMIRSPGSTQNAPKGPGSRGRTAAKRKKADYFIMRSKAGPTPAMIKRAAKELGGDTRLARFMLGGQQRPRFIARRVGRDRRGYEPFIWIVDDVKYKTRFPIQRVALKTYMAQFPIAFERGVARELERRRLKG